MVEHKSIKWTESAWADLENIADYIAKDSPYYAKKLVDEIRFIVRNLTKFPQIGRIVPEVKMSEIREVIIGNYRIVYQITRQLIYIVGIIHTARDLSTFNISLQ